MGTPSQPKGTPSWGTVPRLSAIPVVHPLLARHQIELVIAERQLASRFIAYFMTEDQRGSAKTVFCRCKQEMTAKGSEGKCDQSSEDFWHNNLYYIPSSLVHRKWHILLCSIHLKSLHDYDFGRLNVRWESYIHFIPFWKSWTMLERVGYLPELEGNRIGNIRHHLAISGSSTEVTTVIEANCANLL